MGTEVGRESEQQSDAAYSRSYKRAAPHDAGGEVKGLTFVPRQRSEPSVATKARQLTSSTCEMS